MRERITDRIKIAAADNKKNKKEIGRELDGFKYQKSKAKILKDVLHNINVSLGTLLAATKQLSMLRGSDVTPDGRIGGRGFIMEFREIKSIINDSVKNLSDVTDSIADELTNPKWGLKEKEIKKVEKEQEQVEDKAEEIVEQKPEEDEEEKTLGEVATGESNKESTEEISSDDVEDSPVLKKYKELLSSDRDPTAKTLSKMIMANLSLDK